MNKKNGALTKIQHHVRIYRVHVHMLWARLNQGGTVTQISYQRNLSSRLSPLSPVHNTMLRRGKWEFRFLKKKGATRSKSGAPRRCSFAVSNFDWELPLVGRQNTSSYEAATPTRSKGFIAICHSTNMQEFPFIAFYREFKMQLQLTVNLKKYLY